MTWETPGDVEAARRDVGGHEHLVLAALEPVERLDPLALAAVGMEDAHGVALVQEPGRDAVGAHPRAAEDQDALEVGAAPAGAGAARTSATRPPDKTRGRSCRPARMLAADLDLGRVAERPAGEPLDLGREGRGEEEGLAVLRALLDDALHVGQEAHVEHPVDLVEDEDVDLVQRAVALLEVVEQAAGRRRKDVHPPPEVVCLLPVADAAVDDRHPQVGELGELVEGLLHLEREFAGGLEDRGSASRRGRRAAG